MKSPLVVLAAPILALAAPAAGQAINSQGQQTGPWTTGWQMQSFAEAVQSRDNKSTAIDRRNSARFQAARTARKARERREREARRADRG